MDSRHYNGLSVVSPGQFTPAQRQRLEAFTAAVGLLGKPHQYVDELLRVADYIVSGQVA